MTKRYIPDTGDIVHIHFESEGQSAAPDYKPALVLSPQAYNKRTGLMVCCPITASVKGYPFEVPIEGGAVLSDQVKSLAWADSKISPHGRIKPASLAQVRAKLHALVFKD
jgi:mRNA interferase MazF